MPIEEPSIAFHFRQLLGPDGWVENARLVCRGGTVAALLTDVAPGPGDTCLGVGLPGMSNLHSHAFQRGMAGLAEARGSTDDSFWTWRETMYRFVDRLDPGQLRDIAALAYVEMLESGFTRVGEFHYLHHDRDGRPYADPAEMSAAIVEAADMTGIGLTHLPVFYAHSGFGGGAPGPAQKRFVHDLDGYSRLLDRLVETLKPLPDAVLGLAPHSLRAVTPAQLARLAEHAGDRPVHIHISEQLKEVEDCLAWSGARPVEWLLDNAAVGSAWCLVHATHVTDDEVRAIVDRTAVVGLCPITEANLGDGIFPARRYNELGGRYGIGSDSNVLIDMTAELRLLEYGQRLSERKRTVLARHAGDSTGSSLFLDALRGGAQALGSATGLGIGMAADFLTLDLDHPSLCHRAGARLLDGLVFAVGSGAIDGVWRRGRQIVFAGRHVLKEQASRQFRMAVVNI